jgi:hypothetical protein
MRLLSEIVDQDDRSVPRASVRSWGLGGWTEMRAPCVGIETCPHRCWMVGPGCRRIPATGPREANSGVGRADADKWMWAGGKSARAQVCFSFLIFYSIFSYLLSISSFKSKPLLTSNIYQQLQHVSNYITLFIIIISFEKIYRA